MLAEEAREAMKKLLVGAVLLSVGACGLSAQELAVNKNSVPDGTNVAATFADTSAAHATLLNDSVGDGVARSYEDPGPTDSEAAEPAAGLPSMPAPAPAGKPRLIFGDRDDYRWQLGIGAEFFRFQSNLFNA